MSVVGLDLSLASPGLAGNGMLGGVFTEALRTDPERGDKRLCDIRDWLDYWLNLVRPTLAVIEGVPPYDFASAVLERVHGVAREALARRDVPFAYVNVHALKSFATGNGGAGKSEVMDYVEAETGKRPATNDEADAWVLHQMGAVFLMVPQPVLDLTTVQTKAIDGVAWPLRPGDPSWPQPYGALRRRPVTKKCKHGSVCLKNGDHWLHPFTVSVCDKPPK